MALVLVAAIPLVIVVTTLKEWQIERQPGSRFRRWAICLMLALAAAEEVEKVVEHGELLAGRPGYENTPAAPTLD